MKTETQSRGEHGTLSRRALIPALLALVLMLVGGPGHASAEIEWCRVDPVISVNGTTYNVILSSPYAIFDSATGPTEVVVKVPAGSDYALIATDDGFGFGETVRFVESSSQNSAGNIDISVKVPAKSPLPVLVEVFVGDQVVATEMGKTNQRMSLSVAT